VTGPFGHIFGTAVLRRLIRGYSEPLAFRSVVATLPHSSLVFRSLPSTIVTKLGTSGKGAQQFVAENVAKDHQHVWTSAFGPFLVRVRRHPR
jgi:hypothetical protein